MASWFSNSLKNIWGTDEPQKDEPEVDENNSVKVVIQRILTSTVYEEKLEAFEKLLELSAEKKQDFGKDGIAHVLTILQQEKLNVDIARILLEVVHNLLTSKVKPAASDASRQQQQQKQQDPVVHSYLNSLLPPTAQQQQQPFDKKAPKPPPTQGEILLSTLLSLMTTYDADYYIKYHCISIVGILLRHDVTTVQNCILMDGTGLSKIVNLLQDSHEVIRSEGLALMNVLTSGGNPEVLKIIAFEGVFEKLFTMIMDEGGIKGGIIVQDCLQVVLNLISGNQSNQKYFREIGCVKYLFSLLQVQILSQPPQLQKQENGLLDNILGQQSKLPHSMVNIIYRALVIISELVDFHADTPSATKEIMLKTKILESIVLLALSEDPAEILPENIKTFSLYVLGWLVYRHRGSQDFLQAYNLSYQNGAIESAVVKICKAVLFEENEMKRQLNEDVLRKFLFENNEGQLFIASTVKPPTKVSSVAEEGMLCGISLANAIFGFEKPRIHVMESFHGTCLLSSIVRQNSKCKEILLEIPYEQRTGKPSVSFYGCIVRSSIQSIKQKCNEKITQSFLKLLCEWINGSPASAKMFMENSSNLLFFIDFVNNGNSFAEVLGALLIGLLCVEYDDSGSEGNPGIYTKDALVDATLKRIGINKIRDKFADFQKSADFIAAMNFKQHLFESLPTEASANVPLFDSDFTSFFSATAERILKFLKEAQSPLQQSKSVQQQKNQQQQQEYQQQSVAAVDAQAKQAAAAAISNEDEVLKKYKKMQDKRRQEQEQEVSKYTVKIAELQQALDKLTEDLNKSRNEALQKEQTSSQQVSSLQAELITWQQKFEQKDIEVKSKIKEFSTRCNLAEDQAKKNLLLAEQKEKELDNLARAYDQMEQFAREQEAAVENQKKLIEQAETKAKQLDSDRSSKDSRIKQLEKELAEAQQTSKATIDALRVELKQAQDELSMKHASVSQVDSAAKQFEALARDYKTRAEEAEAAKAQIQELLTSANQKVAEKEQEWNLKVQVQQQVVAEQVSKLEETIADQASKLTSQKSFLDQQTKQVEQLQVQLQQLQAAAPQSVVPQENSANVTEQAYMQTMKRLSESTQQVSELTRRVDALQAELNQTTTIVQQREARIEELEQDNLDMMDIIEKLEEKLKASSPKPPQ